MAEFWVSTYGRIAGVHRGLVLWTGAGQDHGSLKRVENPAPTILEFRNSACGFERFRSSRARFLSATFFDQMTESVEVAEHALQRCARGIIDLSARELAEITHSSVRPVTPVEPIPASSIL